ncbi:hypothetical protein D1B33_05175 [Lysinibacillus yapensis]|uniref:Uncharacterized protein n=1 Tax=Ureibacillus yapensis TaxID=2304605 RepID=A0A396SAC5_9BACL|nr:hypothetical protein [Lysinibacillus yapensis]RHW38281.1 hypothetical protein D1B33_05175 [Lysinibacillus yapensis]
MGIYVNKELPEVFCNIQKIEVPNQAEFRLDELSDLLKQQLLDNRKLAKSIIHLQQTQNDWNLYQTAHLKRVDKRVDDLAESQQFQETLTHQIMSFLEKIEEQNSIMQQTINYDQRFQNDIYQKVIEISQTNDEVQGQLTSINQQESEITTTLTDYSSSLDALTKSVEQLVSTLAHIETQTIEQNTLNQQIAEKISGLEETQKDADHRADVQEGMIEKVRLQVDHLRSILFERSNFLEEKIEKVLQSLAEYFNKLKQ